MDSRRKSDGTDRDARLFFNNLRNAFAKTTKQESPQSVPELRNAWLQFMKAKDRSVADIFEKGTEYAEAMMRLSGKEDPKEMAAFIAESGCDPSHAFSLLNTFSVYGQNEERIALQLKAEQVQSFIALFYPKSEHEGFELWHFFELLKEEKGRSEQRINDIIKEVRKEYGLE